MTILAWVCREARMRNRRSCVHNSPCSRKEVNDTETAAPTPISPMEQLQSLWHHRCRTHDTAGSPCERAHSSGTTVPVALAAILFGVYDEGSYRRLPSARA